MEISVPVQRTVVLEPFIKLVKLVARVFYDNYTTVSHNQQKSARSDSRGTAVVVLDALTRRQWVREEYLAKECLKMNVKLLRKILRHFEGKKFVQRVDRKEKIAKRAKMYSVAVAATTDGRAEDNKFQWHSYYCLDYQQIYDIVRWELLYRIKKKFKDELEDKNTVQEYGCPKCQRKYNALDALRLLSMEDDSFHCEKCNGELVVECEKLTSEEVVDGNDSAKGLRMVEALMGQIHIVKDLPFPEFESLPEWEARAARVARENGGLNPNDPSGSQGGYSSTPMPFLGETKVEVNLGEGKEDVKSEGGDSSQKILPPWMIKQGMKLTEEQRGEMRQQAKIDDGVSGGAVKLSDDKKSAMGSGDDDKDLKDEYIKAYYAALLKQQEVSEKLNQQESAGVLTTPDDIQLAATSSDRQVGMKSKREEEDEEDVEWEEEALVAANGDNKVDLNVEADEEEEEDDVEWEEG